MMTSEAVTNRPSSTLFHCICSHHSAKVSWKGVGPGKKNATPGNSLSFPSPLTPGKKKIISLVKNLSTPPCCIFPTRAVFFDAIRAITTDTHCSTLHHACIGTTDSEVDTRAWRFFGVQNYRQGNRLNSRKSRIWRKNRQKPHVAQKSPCWPRLFSLHVTCY